MEKQKKKKKSKKRIYLSKRNAKKKIWIYAELGWLYTD